MNKALFLDRDGVIIQGVYDNGHIRTVTDPNEIEYVPGIFKLIQKALVDEYKIIIISNQPGIGLGQIDKETFDKITKEIETDFKTNHIEITASYYCFHHPFAKLEEYKKVCECRKPAPGMLLQAAKEHDIDLTKSWFIGDGVNDIKAGHAAGCKTMLVANVLEAEYLRLLEEHLEGIKPDHIIKKLKEAISII
jgi:D,D-heptose 1,7-bisphosphate phosphatase